MSDTATTFYADKHYCPEGQGVSDNDKAHTGTVARERTVYRLD
jgi:hypothetical protein